MDRSEDRAWGVTLEDYSARELNVDAGEEIVKIKTLNGWTWVRRTSDRKEGWVPHETIGDEPVQAAESSRL